MITFGPTQIVADVDFCTRCLHNKYPNQHNGSPTADCTMDWKPKALHVYITGYDQT